LRVVLIFPLVINGEKERKSAAGHGLVSIRSVPNHTRAQDGRA
jgi:hypothetical protein